MIHLDKHNGLMDWPLYGPRDPKIAQLVSQLAHDEGLRLTEIEDVIKSALRQRLAVLKAARVVAT